MCKTNKCFSGLWFTSNASYQFNDMFASSFSPRVNNTHGTTFRALKVTSQVATTRAESAVCDWFCGCAQPLRQRVIHRQIDPRDATAVSSSTFRNAETMTRERRRPTRKARWTPRDNDLADDGERWWMCSAALVTFERRPLMCGLLTSVWRRRRRASRHTRSARS